MPKTRESEFVITDSADEEGRLTVRDVETEETHEIIDYVDEVLAERLADLPSGATVRLELLANPDGSGWAAMRLQSGGAASLGL